MNWQESRKEVQEWIARLGLRPHPEGGHYVQTYRSAVRIGSECLPEGYAGERPASTAIYYLLTGDIFSAFHRLRSDELWHFYAGSPLEIHQLFPESTQELVTIRLGNDPRAGALPQAVIPAGCWFAAQVLAEDGYALVGCTVSPGFDFADFELGERQALLAQFPRHAGLIYSLTRERGV